MRPVGPHRILFIRTDRIGDVLMNLPAIRVLRRAHPKSWIALAADRAVAPLLREHPDLDEIIEIDAGCWKKDSRYRWEWGRRLKLGGFSLAIVSNPDKWMHLAVFLAGIRERVGYRRKWGFLLNKTVADRKATSGRHEIDHNLDLARLVTPETWDGKIELPAAGEVFRRVEARLERDLPGASRILAIHAGTTNLAKRWPAARFAELAKTAFTEGFEVLLIGGAEEKETSAEVARQAGVGLADWTGKLSLTELAALFRSPRVATLVSVDSGPAHVAWIAGKPAVVLYAQDAVGSDPVRWGPRDGKSLTIYKPIGDVTVEEVSDAVRRAARSGT